MINVDNLTCEPGKVRQGSTQIALTFSGSASSNATLVSIVYSVAKDRELTLSGPNQGSIDVTKKELSINTKFNIISGIFTHGVILDVGNGFNKGDQFRITLTVTEQGGINKTRRVFIIFQ